MERLSHIHPIDYRYGSEELRKIFKREAWLEYFKEIEKKLLQTLAETGVINTDIDLKQLDECFDKVDISKVEEWEKIIKHESMAVVRSLAESCGELGKYIHLGATSNDILDCILALQLRDANKILLEKLKTLIQSLIDFVKKHKYTPLLGRTHGRAAIPTTYGFRFSLYLDELFRAYEQLKQSSKMVVVGKLGGAIGTQVELYPDTEKIEEKLLSKLGIERASFYTQVIPRDRLAHYLSSLIVLSSILEHLANEIRIMQRSGINEVVEEFGRKQVGSSVMPHKKNPVLSERICGIGRKIRALSSAIYENIILEDERDLRNSSFERATVPEIILLLDEQLTLANRIVKNLRVNKEIALQNIEKEEPYIYSDLLLQIISKKGGDRQLIHEHLRRILTSKTDISKEELIEQILKDGYLSKYATEKDIGKAFDLEIYIEAAAKQVERLLEYIETKFP